MIALWLGALFPIALPIAIAVLFVPELASLLAAVVERLVRGRRVELG